jgi:hypothetical protein
METSGRRRSRLKRRGESLPARATDGNAAEAPPVPCSDLEGAQLRVTGQGRDSVLPALSFQPALTSRATLVFRWNTDPFPDGTYEIQVVRHFSDGPIPSNRIPVVMQHR